MLQIERYDSAEAVARRQRINRDALTVFNRTVPSRLQIRRYLMAHGWKLDRHYSTSEIWRHPSQAVLVDEAWLPLESPIWPLAALRAAEAIARAESRIIWDVARNLQAS